MFLKKRRQFAYTNLSCISKHLAGAVNDSNYWVTLKPVSRGDPLKGTDDYILEDVCVETQT